MRVLRKDVVMGEIYTLLETTDGDVKVYPNGIVEYYDSKTNSWSPIPNDCPLVKSLGDQGYLRRHHNLKIQ